MSAPNDRRWIDPVEEVAVYMSPDHVQKYQAWLRDQGLYLIPLGRPEDLSYAVGRLQA